MTSRAAVVSSGETGLVKVLSMVEPIAQNHWKNPETAIHLNAPVCTSVLNTSKALCIFRSNEIYTRQIKFSNF